MNLPHERKHILTKALALYGFTPQLDQLGEECAETIIAINKYKRAWRRAQAGGSQKDLEEARLHLLEEIVDVELCSEQVRIFKDADLAATQELTKKKLKRLAERVFRHEARKEREAGGVQTATVDNTKAPLRPEKT